MPQPNLVPVRPRVSRSTQRSGVSGDTSTVFFFPLISSVIGMRHRTAASGKLTAGAAVDAVAVAVGAVDLAAVAEGALADDAVAEAVAADVRAVGRVLAAARARILDDAGGARGRLARLLEIAGAGRAATGGGEN